MTDYFDGDQVSLSSISEDMSSRGEDLVEPVYRSSLTSCIKPVHGYGGETDLIFFQTVSCPNLRGFGVVVFRCLLVDAHVIRLLFLLHRGADHASFRRLQRSEVRLRQCNILNMITPEGIVSKSAAYCFRGPGSVYLFKDSESHNHEHLKSWVRRVPSRAVPDVTSMGVTFKSETKEEASAYGYYNNVTL